MLYRPYHMKWDTTYLLDLTLFKYNINNGGRLVKFIFFTYKYCGPHIPHSLLYMCSIREYVD